VLKVKNKLEKHNEETRAKVKDLHVKTSALKRGNIAVGKEFMRLCDQNDVSTSTRSLNHSLSQSLRESSLINGPEIDRTVKKTNLLHESLLYDQEIRITMTEQLGIEKELVSTLRKQIHAMKQSIAQ
jgi:hypothetical protein